RPCAVAAPAAALHTSVRFVLHAASVIAHDGATTLHSSAAFAAQKDSDDGYFTSGSSSPHAPTTTTPPAKAITKSALRIIRPPKKARTVFSQGELGGKVSMATARARPPRARVTLAPPRAPP